MHGSNWTEQLRWVDAHTPTTQSALLGLKPDPQARLAVRFHLDLKMIPVLERLSEVFETLIFPCRPETTDPNGWSYLQSKSRAHLREAWDPSLCREFLSQGKTSYLCDLGGEMIIAALRGQWPVTAAAEGTTSGLGQIRKEPTLAEARFPIFDWNNARLKREIHNEKMVGFSIWQTFTEITRLSLHGKSVGVLGFGAVGRGISRTARSLGAIVSIHEPNRESATLAAYEGFAPLDKSSLLECSEIIVTATGATDVLTLRELESVPQGAFLLNAGHSETEFSSSIREFPNREKVLKHIEKLHLGEAHSVYLMASGKLLNLAAGFGDTINAFDITSAQLVAVVRAMTEVSARTRPGLNTLPDNFLSECAQLPSFGGSATKSETS